MERSPSQHHNLLQAKLDALLDVAKKNEQKQRQFQKYELALLNCNGLFELLSLVLEQHQKQFYLTDVTLLLLDPEYELQRLLDDYTWPPHWQHRLLFTDDVHRVLNGHPLPRKTQLCAFNPQQHHALFPARPEIRSIAILPLIRKHQVIGSLNLGSRQADRFQPGIGTQFLQHLAAVLSACIENARLQESIKQLGLRDPLTGVNNRRYFDQRLQEEVSLAHRHAQPLSCLFLDLDHFKRINDNYGHQAGDQVLKQSAQIFSACMRNSDVLARYGGEEFVILLPNTAHHDAFEVAERIRQHIAQTQFGISDNLQLQVTLSIGLATLGDENTAITTAQQLVQAADQAVYHAKESGRNRVCYAD